MKISPISFKKKIPLVQCQIKDAEKNKFIPATLYEYDCKDLEDVLEIRNLPARWSFKYAIEQNMKRSLYSQAKLFPKQNFHFYSLARDDNNEVVGLCQTEYKRKNMKVMYLEKKDISHYKYVGQSMLAAIGKHLSEKGGKQLSVLIPVTEVKPFYTEKCGFNDCPNGSLRMKAKEIPDFIHNTEVKTDTEIKPIK